MKWPQVRRALTARTNRVLVLLLVIGLLDLAPYFLSDTGGEIPPELADFEMVKAGGPRLDQTAAAGDARKLLAHTPADQGKRIKGWDLEAGEVKLDKYDYKDPYHPAIFSEVQELGPDLLKRDILESMQYYIFANHTKGEAPGRWVTPATSPVPVLGEPRFHMEFNTGDSFIEGARPTPVDIDGNGYDDLALEASLNLTLDWSTFVEEVIPLEAPGVLDGGLDAVLTTKPRAAIVYPLLDGRAVFSDMTVQGEADDLDSVVEYVQYQVRSETKPVPPPFGSWQEADLDLTGPFGHFAKFSFRLETSLFDNGNYTIAVRAYAGGEYSKEALREVVILNPFYDTRVVIEVQGKETGNATEVFLVYPTELDEIGDGLGRTDRDSRNDTVSVIAIGMTFSALPANFQLVLDPNLLKFNTEVMDTLALINLITEGISARPLDGPFEVGWSCSDILDNLTLTLGYMRTTVEGGFVDGTCITVKLSDKAPETGSMKLELDSELKAAPVEILREITLLKYTFSRPTSMDMEFMDFASKGRSTTSHISIGRVPGQMELRAKNVTGTSMVPPEFHKDGVYYTLVTLSASGEVSNISMDFAEFINGEPENIGYLHVSNVPENLTLLGPFSLVESVLPPSSNGIMDYILKSFTSVMMMGFDELQYIPFDVILVERGLVHVECSKSIDTVEVHYSPSGSRAAPQRVVELPGAGPGAGLPDYITLFEDREDTLPGISMRFSGFIAVKMELTEELMTFELNSRNTQPFSFANIHPANRTKTGLGGYDYEAIYFSNIPGWLKVSLNREILPFTLDMHSGAPIRGMSFITRHYNEETGLNDYLYLGVDSLPTDISFKQGNEDGNETILLDTGGSGYFGKIEFCLTNSDYFTLSDNYFVAKKDGDRTTLSGAFSGLGKISFMEKGEDADLEFRFEKNLPLRMYYETKASDPADDISTRVFMKNMPAVLKLTIPTPAADGASIADISGPSDDNGTTLSAIAGIFAGIGEMISSFLSTADTAGRSLSTGLAAEREVSIDLEYEFDGDLDLTVVGTFTKGQVNLPEPVSLDFVHGIVLVQDQATEGIEGRFYLTGLPSKGRIKFQMEGAYANATFDLLDFSPRIDHITVVLRGFNGNDADLALTGLSTEGTDIFFDASMRLEEEIPAWGRVTFSTNRAGPSIHVDGHSSQRDTNFTMDISGVPSSITEEFEIGDSIFLSHSASEPIDRIVLNVSRENGTMEAYGMLEQIPESITLGISDLAIDRDTFGVPVDLSGIPTFYLSSSNSTLDAYLKMRSREYGEKSSMEVLVTNLSTSMYSEYDGGDYTVHVHDMDRGLLYIRDLEVTKRLTAKKMLMSFENISYARVSFVFTGGFYPGLSVTGDTQGRVDYHGTFRLKVLGMSITPFMALRRLSVTDTFVPAVYDMESKKDRFDLDPREGTHQIILLGIAPTIVLNFWWLFPVLIGINTGRKLWLLKKLEKLEMQQTREKEEKLEKREKGKMQEKRGKRGKQ